mgnify:CR=1 FL=1
MNLDEIRKNIDEIDSQIIELFAKRMACARQVAEYKKSHSVGVLQSSREQQIIARAIDKMDNEELKRFVPVLMNCLMEMSKDYQREFYDDEVKLELDIEEYDPHAKIGYFGAVGSNTQRATKEYFGSDNAESFASFEEIFKAVSDGTIKYGVLPIENSSTGAITDMYDLLGKYDLYIVGEKWLRIEHALLGKCGTKSTDIRRVFSHPQALLQCRDWLKENDMECESCASTATACQIVADSDDSSVGAVADPSNAEIYGLSILEKNIATCKDNFTRFVVIANKLIQGESDKVSVHFVLKNNVGSLYNALKIFARYNVNMLMIESRPIRNNPQNYSFYVDLDGDCRQKNVLLALDNLQQNSTIFKLIGAYKTGEIK